MTTESYLPFFDRFPRLKFIIGHNGEMLPFMLERTGAFLAQMVPMKRNLLEVWDSNIWVTTSGMFTIAPFLCLAKTTRKSRILYSVGYPLSTNEEGAQFIDLLSKSGLVTDEELEMIAYRNAETLLKVKV